MQLISSEAKTGDAELTTVPGVELESFKFLHLPGCFYMSAHAVCTLYYCFINISEVDTIKCVSVAASTIGHTHDSSPPGGGLNDIITLANVMLRPTSSMRVDASKLL